MWPANRGRSADSDNPARVASQARRLVKNSPRVLPGALVRSATTSASRCPSPHYSRTPLANNAGLIGTLGGGGPERIRRRRYAVTPHPSWRMGTRSAHHHVSSRCRREWLLVRSAVLGISPVKLFFNNGFPAPGTAQTTNPRSRHVTPSVSAVCSTNVSTFAEGNGSGNWPFQPQSEIPEPPRRQGRQDSHGSGMPTHAPTLPHHRCLWAFGPDIKPWRPWRPPVAPWR